MVDETGAIARLRGFLRDGRAHQVVTINTDFARLAQGDPAFRAILNAADLAVADGTPIVWLSRLLGNGLPARVAGLELMEASCRLAAESGVGVFLLGARPGVAAEAARVLQVRHPGLRIAGTACPPFGEWTVAEEAEVVEAIGRAGRCVLFVAFGAPRQDRFIAAHLAELDVPIAMGVGCGFDIIAGTQVRAPQWMRRSGLEWLWRLAHEPQRLAGRYLLRDAPFLVRSAIRAVTSTRGTAARA